MAMILARKEVMWDYQVIREMLNREKKFENLQNKYKSSGKHNSGMWKITKETKKWRNRISQCTKCRYDSEGKWSHQINKANDAAYKVSIKSNRNIKTFIADKKNHHCHQKD